MKGSIIKTLLILGSTIGIFWYIDHNFTFNFVALFCVLCALMIIMFFIKEYKIKDQYIDGEKITDFIRVDGVPCQNRGTLFWSYFIIVVFGILSIYTFGNYVNPDKKIFYNYDHHAIKVEGIKVNEGFFVAGNDGQSFLDNSTINGSIRVAHLGEDGVTLQLNGVTSPIYVKEYDEDGDPQMDTCINARCLFPTDSRDTSSYRATFVGLDKDANNNNYCVDITIDQKHEDQNLLKLKRGKDSTIYSFGRGDDLVASSFTKFIKGGYPLQSIALDAYTQMDLGGVNLIRPAIYRNLKQKDIKGKYHQQDYLIELEKQNNIKSISVNGQYNSVNGQYYSVDDMLKQIEEVTIPYDKAFYVGFGEDATQSVKFTKCNVDDSGNFEVALKYELPRYQALSSTNRGRETSLMVASSIINAQENSDDSGLIDNIAENLALFHLFENHGNDMHIKPFFVSYVSDISNVEMVFRLLTDGGAGVQNGITAGTYLPGITSQDGNYEWLISIENFKETTPFTADKLVWILFGVVILSAFSMLYSSTHGLYTTVECATHLLLIAYLTVKFFLLWRTTVFSPVSSITFFEFNHFRDPSWLSIIVYCLGFFYVAIFAAKLYILKFSDESIFSLLPGVFQKFGESQPELWRKWTMGGGIALFVISSAALALPSMGVLTTILLWVGLAIGFVGVVASLYNLLPQATVSRFTTVAGVISAGLIILGLSWTKTYPMLLLCALAILCFVRYLVVIIPNRQNLRWVVFAAIPVIAVAYVIIEMLLARPMFRVVGGALIYFAVDWFIYKIFSASYVADYVNAVEDNETSDKTAFSLSIWNMLCMSGATLIADGGYGIMFTLFAIFATWVKIIDVSNYEVHSNRRFKWLPTVLLLIILAAIIGVIVGYKNIFLGLYDAVAEGREYSFVFMAVAIFLAVVAAVMVALNIRFRWWHLAIPIAVIVGAGVATHMGVLDKFTGGHTEYRIRVHMETPGEVLSKVEDNSEQNRFLQASLNDWILHEYQSIGEEIVTFGEGGTGYFKLQPQSKVGAMWFAQTTDICLSRYIIAEHGLWLAMLFVLSFSVYLFIALYSVAIYRWSRVIVIQVALLFAVQSLMIFLANTRSFIFFGQDFPLISITSRVSALYFFILVALGVISALFGKNQFNRMIDDNAMLYVSIRQRQEMGSAFIVLLFLLAVGSLYWGGHNKDYSEGIIYSKAIEKHSPEEILSKTDFKNYAYYNQGVYNIEFLMAKVANDLDNYITPALKMYQRELNHRVPLRRDMSSFVDSLYKCDTMQIALEKCDPITIRLLKHYKESGSKNNSLQNVICLRNVRSISYDKVRGENSYKVIYHDTLEFATGINAINYHMPTKRRTQWTGSIIEADSSNVGDSVRIYNDSIVYIPDSLTKGEAVQLVPASTSGRRVVIGADGIVELNPQGLNVANVRRSDFVINDQNRALDSLPLQRSTYFAKNILINGERAFLYPFGHKMFWSRDVVGEIMTTHKRLLKDNGEGLPNTDIALSIDSELTMALYKVYSDKLGHLDNMSVAADRAVIVTDGDGRVQAMVDYRSNKKYRLNPNDYSRIGEISDSLYINFEKGRATETRYFGNFSRNNLRRGPGSTQKPIVWTAVTTMYNTGWWTNLNMLAPRYVYLDDKHKTISGKHNTFKQYAGEPLETTFKSLAGDEKGVNGVIDIKNYIYKSSNYYNSIMAYIGAFTKESLVQDDYIAASKERDGNTMFFKVNNSSIPGYKQAKPQRQKGESGKQYDDRLKKWFNSNTASFPEMRISKIGGNSTLSFNRFLSSDIARGITTASDTMALLPAGLSTNFGLKLYKDYDSLRPRSFFNLAVREGRTKPRQLNEYMVRSVAIGSNTIWNVSPYDMAEMYGRLITLNKNYSLSLYNLDQSKTRPPYEQFTIDDSWGKDISNYLNVRNELIKGMSLVYKSNGTAEDLGTAKKYKDDKDRTVAIIKIDDGKAEESSSSVPTFYVYGKTGTINGYWNGIDKEDHLLVTIIADRKLTQCSAEELQEVKYFIIYQVDYEYYDNGGWKTLDQSIINAVVTSKAFLDYMNTNK